MDALKYTNYSFANDYNRLQTILNVFFVTKFRAFNSKKLPKGIAHIGDVIMGLAPFLLIIFMC